MKRCFRFALEFIRRHKKLFISLLAVAAILIAAAQFVAVQWWDTNVGENVMSVVFDKKRVKSADRAVFEANGADVLIEEVDFVKQIAKETLVAVARGYMCPVGKYKIKLYAGEKLIRTIELSEELSLARFYFEDSTHWVIGGEEGWGHLSKDLANKLRELAMTMT